MIIRNHYWSIVQAAWAWLVPLCELEFQRVHLLEPAVWRDWVKYYQCLNLTVVPKDLWFGRRGKCNLPLYSERETNEQYRAFHLVSCPYSKSLIFSEVKWAGWQRTAWQLKWQMGSTLLSCVSHAQRKLINKTYILKVSLNKAMHGPTAVYVQMFSKVILSWEFIEIHVMLHLFLCLSHTNTL